MTQPLGSDQIGRGSSSGSGFGTGRSSRDITDEAHRGSLPMPAAAEPAELPNCIVLEDKYRLLNEIGRGSMGTVFMADDLRLQRQVAVKFLLPELVNSAECADRFHSEAVAMAAIRDHNVAQIFSYGDVGGTPYFVMEYLDGETVENLIDAHNRRGFFVPLADAVDVLSQALAGLESIHRAGVVHRDIKPANIMLTRDPFRAVIMDFGLVRDVKVEEDTRALAGTPAYIAPELVEGVSDAARSPLVDVYSMGTTAYELVTGSIPFGGETWVEILQKHITEVPVDPSKRRPGLPSDLDEVILRAMAKDPRERYQSCSEFLDELLRVAGLIENVPRRESQPPAARTSGQRRSSRPFRSPRSTPGRGFRSTPKGNRGRLMVIDPDPDFRALVHGTAKAAVPGCRVHSATDGAMALDLMNELRPHVVLLDLSLPEINGLEVVATIRGDKAYNGVELVVVANNGGQQEAAILEGLGVSHFLTKPIDSDTLADILRPLLEGSLSDAPPRV